MDEQNVATNVEVDNSQVTATPTDTTINTETNTNVEVDNTQIADNTPVVDNSQVINQPTPMDSNTTYDNIEEEQPFQQLNRPENVPDISQEIAQMEVDQSYEENLQLNNGQALQNFLENEYDYDKSEAGTYWVAGAINDVDTQMKFLDTLINEEMYDEMELTKFYYDNTMATARAYAAQKKKEVAYGFYRAAQEKAIAEASLTGWYMPAEGEYMLGQYTIAQNTLDRSDATPEEKNRAQRVVNVTEKWFNANHIGTRGMKCLSLLQYEETVRHNKANEALQHQANQIAAAGNAISAALQDLEMREWKFSLEEMELQTGHDWTGELGLDNDNIIGHNQPKDYERYQNLRGYGEVWTTKDGSRKLLTIGGQEVDPTKQITLLGPDEKAPKDWLEYNKEQYKKQGLELVQGEDGKWYTEEKIKISGLANLLTKDPYYYSAIIGAIGSEAVNETLKENGLDPDKYYARYQAYLGDQYLKENHEKNGNKLDESYLTPQTYKLTEGDGKGKNVYTFHCTENGESVTKAYYKDKDGNFVQIKDGNIKLTDGTLSDKIKNLSTSSLKYQDKTMQIGDLHTSTQFDTHKVKDTNTGQTLDVLNTLPKGSEKTSDGDHAEYTDENGVTHYFEYVNYSWKLGFGERVQNVVQGIFNFDGDQISASEATSYGWVEVASSEYPDDLKKETAKKDTKSTDKKENNKSSTTKTSGGSGSRSHASVASKESETEDTDAYHIEKTSVSMDDAPEILNKETPFVLGDSTKRTTNDVVTTEKEVTKPKKKKTSVKV